MPINRCDEFCRIVDINNKRQTEPSHVNDEDVSRSPRQGADGFGRGKILHVIISRMHAIDIAGLRRRLNAGRGVESCLTRQRRTAVNVWLMS